MTSLPQPRTTTTSSEHYWLTQPYSSRTFLFPAPQSGCTAIHLLANHVYTSHLLSSVGYSKLNIPSATPELATAKLVSQSFVWPAIQEDCQCLKASRHTVTTFCKFPLPPSRFLQIHVDLVGPLPSSAGFQYCLTAVDRFTCWSAAFPHPITAETVSHALLSGWIYRFGCPQTITTDQGSQFDSEVFHCVAKLCGIHPVANGLVERLHRTLKAAIM